VLRPANRVDSEKQALDRQKRALMKDLNRIFTELDLEKWLDTPNSRLGGRKPKDMLGTPDQQHVVDLIEAVKYGLMT
jgi:uncharacterized protein (DUF2384 family)